MTERKRPWKPSYDASMAFCGYVSDGECTPDGVEHMWHNVFGTVLKYLGFPRKARSFLWRELVWGNWERLHLTDEERAKTPEHWLEELRADVWYCSDRWGFDRLTRCHWLYRAYIRTVEKIESSEDMREYEDFISVSDLDCLEEDE